MQLEQKTFIEIFTNRNIIIFRNGINSVHFCSYLKIFKDRYLLFINIVENIIEDVNCNVLLEVYRIYILLHTKYNIVEFFFNFFFLEIDDKKLN